MSDRTINPFETQAYQDAKRKYEIGRGALKASGKVAIDSVTKEPVLLTVPFRASWKIITDRFSQ